MTERGEVGLGVARQGLLTHLSQAQEGVIGDPHTPQGRKSGAQVGAAPLPQLGVAFDPAAGHPVLAQPVQQLGLEVGGGGAHSGGGVRGGGGQE